VLWGAYHGILLIAWRPFERATGPTGWKRLLRATVFFQFTCVGWLLFRAQNVGTIRLFLESIFLHPNWSEQATADVVAIVRHAWLLIVFQAVQAASGTLWPLPKMPAFVRLNVWFLVVFSTMVFGRGDSKFIYFAF
jgi:hypothetical protein